MSTASPPRNKLAPEPPLFVAPTKNNPYGLTEAFVTRCRLHPHLIGHLAGKTLLTDMHSEWIRGVWESGEDESFQAHRGSYKTTGIAEIGMVWWLLFHLDDRLGYLRKKFNEAWDIINNVAQIISNPSAPPGSPMPVRELFKFALSTDIYEAPYPKMGRRSKNDGKIEFNFKSTVTPEGNLNAFGIDGSLTGAHTDRFMCDDFVTLKDRISKAEREHTIEVIREIRTNIIDPGKPVAFIGTPWHKQDAWSILPEPEVWDWHRTGLLTEEFAASKKKTTTPALWAANYELKHVSSEDALFSDPEYARWDWAVKPVYAQLDAGFDGDSTTALTIGARINDTIQMKGWTWTENVDDITPRIVEIMKAHRVTRVYNETNPDKGYLAKELRGLKMTVKTYHEKMNKHVKIAAYLKKYWPEIRWDPDTDDTYMEQIVDYAEGQSPNDAPDSAASLLRGAFYSAAGIDSLYSY